MKIIRSIVSLLIAILLAPIRLFVKPKPPVYRLHRSTVSIGGGRRGTAIAPEDKLIELFGSPDPVETFDDKVTKQWIFKTPKGYAGFRDYWWNSKTEWSLVGETSDAVAALQQFLATFGITVSNEVRGYLVQQ